MSTPETVYSSNHIKITKHRRKKSGKNHGKAFYCITISYFYHLANQDTIDRILDIGIYDVKKFYSLEDAKQAALAITLSCGK